MKLQTNSQLNHAQRGSALIVSLIIVFVLSMIATAALVVNVSNKNAISAIGNRTRAMYMAETGLSEALLQLATITNRTGGGPLVPLMVGSKNAPTKREGGRFWYDINPNADGTYTVTSSGAAALATRRIRAVLQPDESVFDHAIFAGNSDNDPAYALKLSGTGAAADQITGDIYSAGDIDITGDAGVAGDIMSGGTITGAPGNEGVNRRIPDIAAMDYATNNDFDVAAMFGAASWQSSSLGGSAYQLPDSSPAHIFRKDPDDRASETSSTAKSDYFLEDPYEAASVSGTHTLSLSGVMGNAGPSGTDKVYYIDGNLWVHNRPYGKLKFKNTDAEGARITFVVKGNVYFSDDILLDDETKDAVAFIAIKDDAHKDSGNIYMGDPRYGTLDDMQAYLYAENNFYDNNLSASGSSEVTIKGNMTAGNHVAINRDFVKSDGTVAHSKLTIDFDDRISTGAIELPGLPGAAGSIEGYTVVLWHEIPVE